MSIGVSQQPVRASTTTIFDCDHVPGRRVEHCHRLVSAFAIHRLRWFYSLVDVVLTTGSLAVSRLITHDGSRRFQFGYWHLEPLVVELNATVLTTTCTYAAITAAHDLSDGGNVMRSIVNERGYLDFASYVAKFGRMRFIDIHILLPPDTELGTISSVDDVRAEIATRLDGDMRAEWLNIMLTSKRGRM
jgi:predicted Co/Zn/Cd cation transporter (cation efflux family)